MYLYSKTTILGSAVSCLLFGVTACGGSYFTTSDQAMPSGEASQTKLDAPTDDGGTTQEDSGQPVNEAGIVAWHDTMEGGADIVESGVNTSHDANTSDQAAAMTEASLDGGSDGNSVDAAQDAVAPEACHPVCRFIDQGAYYVSPNYSCGAATCDAGESCTVTNMAYGTTFQGTLECL